jgi:hypothetical protein
MKFEVSLYRGSHFCSERVVRIGKSLNQFSSIAISAVRAPAMRQPVLFAAQQTIPSAAIQAHTPSLEVQVDFPVYRQKTANDNWRKDVTLTRIDASGASVSLRHIRGITYEQESVEITIGREPVDTGNMAYSLGQNEFASGPDQFAQLLALHARLLAKASDQVGAIPEAAADQLLASVNALKQNGQRQDVRARQ